MAKKCWSVEFEKQTLADKFCHLASERLSVYGTEDGEGDDNVDGALVFGEEVQQGLGGLMGEIDDDIDIEKIHVGHPHLGEDSVHMDIEKKAF